MSDFTRETTARYEAQRAALTAAHDEGAGNALAACAELEVDCMAYCYGGSARLNVAETLADLAENGWRLVRSDTEQER